MNNVNKKDNAKPVKIKKGHLDYELEMNKKEERKYLKAEEEKHKNRSFLARIFFSKDGQLIGIKSGLFFLTIVIIAFVSEVHLKKMYIGEECSLGYAGSWTEKNV